MGPGLIIWLMLLLSAAFLLSQGPVEARAKDWRNGAIVYQVFVDRFAPPSNLDAKRKFFAPPRTLRQWSDLPFATEYDEKLKTYPHVLEFWGGDLASLDSRLSYIKRLGADVLYLNPIFKAPSNHKYDTEDYFKIDPAYGASADLRRLISDVHGAGMRIMLDGVFNHIGQTSPIFREALAHTGSKRRDWFFFGRQYPNGYRGWAGVASLPGLRLENPDVQNFLWGAPNSVVKTYLQAGIDGWRLDVGFELGPKFLRGITEAAHSAKPGSEVVGEISGYPSDWFPSVDGVFDFTAMNLSIGMLSGQIRGGVAGRMLEHIVQDAGIENLLKSWLLVDNHDTPRFAEVVPDPNRRRVARILQFTLPGSPVIYYGSELGMTGRGDPENRAPMRWDLATDENEDLAATRKMISIRRSHPALRYGDFTALDTDRLLAFSRTTGKLRDTVIVAVNPTDRDIEESFTSRVGKVMSWGEMEDVLTGERVRSVTGMLDLTIHAGSAMILVPVTSPTNGYSPYNRVE